MQVSSYARCDVCLHCHSCEAYLELSLTVSLLCPQKWKLVWLSLFPPSSSGVGRLEIQEAGGTASISVTSCPGVALKQPLCLQLFTEQLCHIRFHSEVLK